MIGALTGVSAFLLVATAIGAAGGLVIAAIGWRRRETPAAKAFTLFVLSQSGWSLAAVGLWTSQSYELALGFRLLSWELSLISLLSWLYFTLVYTGRLGAFAGWPRRLVVGWAGATFVTHLIDPWVGLTRANFGLASYEGLTLVAYDTTPLFGVQLLVIYGLILGSYWVMFQFYRDAHPGQRTQAGLILAADVLFVLASFAYYAGGLSLSPFLDPTPLFFFVAVVGIAFALFYYDFLKVTPLAMDLLLEEMADPIAVVGEHGQVVDTNEPGRAVGLQTGAPVSDACPALAAALDSNESTITLSDADEPERTFDLSVTPVSDHHGQQRGTLLVLRDVTELKRRERELEAANEELEQFASVVSHDLRNPLSVASGNAELALQTGDVDHVESVVDALDEMDALIDDLLNLAQEGRAIDDTERVSLAAVVTEAWHQVDTGDTEFEADCSGTVSADRQRFIELLGNLYANAVEHGRTADQSGADSGTETFRVSVGMLDDGTGIFVEDNGRGIPPEDRPTVFESGMTTSGDGTGLGLAIVQKIADGHGWAVAVTDGSDGGARFELSGMARSEAPVAE